MVELAFIASVIGIAWILTREIRTHALTRGILDRPNARSSHTAPTPRGGGLAIVITIGVGLFVLWISEWLRLDGLLVSCAGAFTVAVAGYVDDHRSLEVLPRLLSHVLAAVLALFFLWNGDEGTVPFSWLPMWANWVLVSLAIVWSINLFNFMDGIDGLAASQAVFVTAASALLAGELQGDSFYVLLLTAGAVFGFLLWNRPPAKIFMGDVGSGFLGFWLAAVAVALDAWGVLDIWVSVVLNSVFIADATVTLLRRFFSGKRASQAHRSHAYQLLSRKWRSHSKVTSLAWGVNLTIVLACGYAAVDRPALASWIAVGLIIVLAAACLACGAGSEESP